MSFAVLMVCTGNVCRSPAAAALFRAGLAAGADVLVASAGTGALVDEGIDPPTAAALREFGVDPSGHRARQLELRMPHRADLVLTAERAHRDQIMTDLPTAFRRTFTLAEFARLAAEVDPAVRARGPVAVVADAAARRGGAGDSDTAGDADDIRDPFRADTARAREVTAEIRDAVRVAVRALGFAPDASPAVPSPESRTQPGRRPRPHRDGPDPAAPRRPSPVTRS